MHFVDGFDEENVILLLGLSVTVLVGLQALYNETYVAQRWRRCNDEFSFFFLCLHLYLTGSCVSRNTGPNPDHYSYCYS